MSDDEQPWERDSIPDEMPEYYPEETVDGDQIMVMDMPQVLKNN